MSALAETSVTLPASVHPDTLLPPPSRATYIAAALIALAVHALILFAWPPPAPVIEPAEFAVEAGDASVEVSLVAALPAEEPAAEIEPPPPVVPPPPAPEPPPIAEPPPVEPVAKPEMVLPTPVTALTPPQLPAPREKPRAKPAPKPMPAARIARAVGDGSSTVPGNDATTVKAAPGGASAKPGYLRNPHPTYPEAARAARQQGVVMLLVNVDASGNVASVRIARSSGFPLLDERARSTVAGSWKFKPARANGVPIGSSVTIPIRFTLGR